MACNPYNSQKLVKSVKPKLKTHTVG